MEINKLLEDSSIKSISIQVDFKDGSCLSFKRNDSCDDIIDEDSD